jgi:hypothetical protein
MSDQLEVMKEELRLILEIIKEKLKKDEDKK